MYAKLPLDKLVFFVSKYFTVSDEVSQIKNFLLDKYELDVSRTIAVCYRGNDKCNETKIPIYEDVDRVVRELISLHPSHRVLIQSDELEFCTYMQSRFNGIVIEETFKIRKNPKLTVQYVIPLEKRVQYAQIFLAVMQILSSCRQVVVNAGNVGLWVALFRGHSNGMHEYFNGQWFK